MRTTRRLLSCLNCLEILSVVDVVHGGQMTGVWDQSKGWHAERRENAAIWFRITLESVVARKQHKSAVAQRRAMFLFLEWKSTSVGLTHDKQHLYCCATTEDWCHVQMLCSGAQWYYKSPQFLQMWKAPLFIPATEWGIWIHNLGPKSVCMQKIYILISICMPLLCLSVLLPLWSINFEKIRMLPKLTFFALR